MKNFTYSKHAIRITQPMLAIVLCLAVAHHSFAQNAAQSQKSNASATAWKALAPMPQPRFEIASAVVDGKFYVFGGFGPRAQATKQCDVYDPAKNTWSKIADMPQALTHNNAVVDGHTVWFAGGYDGSPGTAIANVWKYDVNSNTFKEGPPLPEVRAGGGLALVGRTLHFFGGLKDRDTDCPEHWTMSADGGKEWKLASPMLKPRNQFGVAVVAGKVYLLGGQFNHDSKLRTAPNDQPLVTIYDPAADKWTEGPPLPKPLSHFEPSTVVADGKIIVFGGRSVKTEESAVYGFDPASGKWSTLTPIPKAVFGPAAVLVDDKIITTGGAITGYTPQPEAWSIPVKDLWAMGAAR